MNQQRHRPHILLAPSGPLWPKDPALHIPVERALEPELLAFREVFVRQIGGGEVGYLGDDWSIDKGRSVADHEDVVW